MQWKLPYLRINSSILPIPLKNHPSISSEKTIKDKNMTENKPVKKLFIHLLDNKICHHHETVYCTFHHNVMPLYL